MSRAESEELLGGAIAIARRAGEAILAIYGGHLDIAHKADHSPLTQADLASHRLICAALRALTPSLPVLSEESAALPYAERSGWREYWLIDPLDGTKEFISRNGEFTVNIALVREHEPVLGVVHVPVSGTTYYAARDEGAWKQLAGAAPAPIAVQIPCASPVRVVGSRSHGNPRLHRYLEPLGAYELVNMGSALKVCLVAEGKADLYPRLGPTSEWDTAAAHAIAAAAGGRVLTLSGRPLQYNRKDSLLNPEFLVFADDGRGFVRLFEEYAADAQGRDAGLLDPPAPRGV